MAGLTITGLVKRFGATAAVDGIDLALAQGERVAVLGPSGCGKTTLLRLVAGFETLDAGRIALGERVLARPGLHLPAERRGIGIVFQHHALWPHMSVAGNVAYPLAVRSVAGAERRRRVDEALARVGLAGFGPRRPAELSGGQRQRVAIARCLVMAPRLVLLDEPLSSLDPHLRASLLDALQEFHRATGAAMLYITHDQGEAMALGERVAVMAAGRLVQLAPPRLVYREPATPLVAGFVGQGGMVAARLTGPVVEGRAPISLLGYAATARARPGQEPGPIALCLRPEDLRLAGRGEAGFAVIVKRSVFRGAAVAVEVVPEGQKTALLVLNLGPDAAPAPGSTLKLAIVDGWVVPEG